jgi:ferredoxin
MNIKHWVTTEFTRRQVTVEGQVVPDGLRCVQCGICSYHCPVGIDVRRHAWLGNPIKDSHCLTCGECISRCPRGVLRFEKSNLFTDPDTDVQNIIEKAVPEVVENV